MFFEAKPDVSALRRKPVRTGVWREGPDGTLTLLERDGNLYRIKPIAGRWRLSAGPDGSRAHARGGEAFEAESREGCLVMAALMRDHARSRAEWGARRVDPIRRPSHLPGLDLCCQKNGLSIHAYAVDAATGAKVGDFNGSYTDWRGTWVLGEGTVNTSSSIPEDRIGTGLGRALYDLVEEVAGLPLAPQGRNHVGGGLSGHSRRFWDRRSAHARVPGLGDPAVEARCSVMDEINAAIHVEARRMEPEMMVSLAYRTGLPVEVMASDARPGPFPCFAWCLAPDGRAVTTWGPENRDDVIAAASARGQRCGPAVLTDARGLAELIGRHRAPDPSSRVAAFEPADGDAACAEALVARHGLDLLGATKALAVSP